MIPFFRRKLKTLNRVEILPKNIVSNFNIFASLLPGKMIFPVLKSNAYGHGILPVVEILDPLDFPLYVADSYYEALKIRKVSKKKILIIGYNHPSNYKDFRWKNISVSVYDLDSIRALSELCGSTINIHLKINTGMNRQGIHPEELPLFLKEIASHPHLHLEGVLSHLADGDNPENDFTKKQEKTFSKCLDIIESEGFSPEYIHLGNTAGGMKLQDKRINGIRPGIGLFGYNPLEKKDKHFKDMDSLKPALRVISTLIHTQKLKKGEKVSYNLTFEAPRDMEIGLVPAGYYECVPRALSNTGSFTSMGCRLPILGRICMNLTSFDLSKALLSVGDPVTIISENPGDPNSIENIARLTGTITYEILVHISETMRRFIVPS